MHFAKKGEKGKAANKKGSQNILDGNLRTFVVKTEKGQDDKGKPKFGIELNPNILNDDAKESITRWAGGGKPAPWQFDADEHLIYCGLHRNYYKDAKVWHAVNHNEHQIKWGKKKKARPGMMSPKRGKSAS